MSDEMRREITETESLRIYNFRDGEANHLSVHSVSSVEIDKKPDTLGDAEGRKFHTRTLTVRYGDGRKIQLTLFADDIEALKFNK